MKQKTIPCVRSTPVPSRPRTLVLAVGLAVSGIGGSSVVLAEEGAGGLERAFDMPRIHVVGPDETGTVRLPGAVKTVTAEEIEQAQPRSTEDVLRRVPGVYIKGEEDSALVTNVGVRGIPAGDYKTLVLEDGVPIQPGTFVGNGRYYNPRIQRMDGVELLKGASALRYGPNNIGGVINYQTRTPEDGVVVGARVGSWNTREATIEAGGSSLSGDALFGVIATQAESDGWMDKGWNMTDVMVKAGTAIGNNQFVGTKFSYYENEANISYRGYFEDAYDAGATFNPAPDDYFLTERKAFDINHEWDISPDRRLQSLVYWSEMSRDYWRYNVDGTTTNSSGDTVWNFTDVLEGRNRDFQRLGVESRLTLNHGAFGIGNEAELGVRWMQEAMHDTRPRANRDAPRDPISLSDTEGDSALRRNREDSADSLALFAQNRFDIDDRLSVTAGLRMETYEQRRKNLQEGSSDSYTNTELLPGVGATYWLNPSAQLYGSIYQAFAPPLVGSVVDTDDEPTEAEKSLNVEFGLRGGDESFSYEVTAFHMDFSNQVDPGISGIQAPNEGSAVIQGLEAGIGHAIGHGFRVDGNVTWIPTAKFGEDRAGDGGAEKGNRLPWSPEWTANLSVGYRTETLRTALLFNYTDEVYGDGMNHKAIDPEEHMGGRIPSYYTLDLTAGMDITPALELSGAIKNLTDERYIAGLRQGIYAGPERSFEVGARYRF